MSKYDYIVVGGGPTGLTLGWYLSKLGKKILIIERENSLGGCHRVKRVNGLFTEHGPRIYIDNYYTFMSLLKDMEISFHDIFTPYNFSIGEIGGQSIGNFSFRELFYLTVTFIRLSDTDKKITMSDYLKKYNFSNKAKTYIDRLCRLTDGAGIERYTLYQFMQIINQNFLYNTYQPKKPNDIGLVKIWEDKLKKNDVRIMLNTEVLGVY